MPRSQIPLRRRSAAVAALGLATMGPLLDAWAGGQLIRTPWFTLAVVLAGFLVGSWLQPRSALSATALGAALLTAANQVGDPGSYSVVNDYFFFALLTGGPVLAGALISGRTAQLRALRTLSRVRDSQHAAELRTARLEQHSRLQAEVASVMLGQLEAIVTLARQARRNPADAEAVVAIEAAGRTVLEDLRGVVGVLRAAEPISEPRENEDLLPPPPVLAWTDVVAACSGIPLAVEAVAGAHSRGPALANVVLAVLVGLPLLVRRRRPLTAILGVVAVATLMSAVLTPLPTTVTVLAPLSLAAYAVGALTRGSRRILGVGVLMLGLVATVAVSPATDRDPSGLLPTLAWFGVTVLFGVVSEQYASRATRLGLLLARVENGRRHELELVAAEQRATLASELHDNLAHAMTVVCLHAEAAQLVAVSPADVRTSLDAVEAATRQALVEIRSGLAALVTLAEPQELRPEIVRLADGLGLDPVVEVHGAPTGSPDETAVLLRVVREALVNVARHAPGAPVTVRIQGCVTTVTASVWNGPAVAAPLQSVGTGSGLRGLDAQVRSAGGRLRWGAGHDDGFQVTLELPIAAIKAVASAR